MQLPPTIMSWIMLLMARSRPFQCTAAFIRFTPISFTIRHSTLSTFQRHATSHPNKDTLYTINDDVCPALSEDVLQATVTKHCATLLQYLQNKPIARHTLQAFDDVVKCINKSNMNNMNSDSTPIILDSGCGTGKSSLILGEQYPNHFVIGIDKSISRLSRNWLFRNSRSSSSIDGDVTEKDAASTAVTTQQQHQYSNVQQVSTNVLLVRAELVDFWRLILEHQQQYPWNVTHHFILYPNPYPKKSRFKSRWYAHPSFPLILQIGGNLHLRSNWKGYLEEFRASVVIANEYNQENAGVNYAAPYMSSCKSTDCLQQLDPFNNTTTPAMTNFEQKYRDIGEPTYQLILNHDDTCKSNAIG